MANAHGQQAFLDALIGEWSYSFATEPTAEHPDVTATGTETVRRVGPAWLLLENRGGGADCGASHSVTLLSVTEATGRFTGAVAGSAVAALFCYDGELAEDGSAVYLETTGPAMTPGQTTDRYRDILRVLSPDTRETVAEVWSADDVWVEFMRTQYSRNKTLAID